MTERTEVKYINPDAIILAPIPFNFLIGWSCEAYWRMRHGPEGLRKRLDEARVAGFREGLEAGKRQATFAYEQAVKMERWQR